MDKEHKCQSTVEQNIAKSVINTKKG